MIDLVEAESDGCRDAEPDGHVPADPHAPAMCLIGDRAHPVRVDQVVELDLAIPERIVPRDPGDSVFFAVDYRRRRACPKAGTVDEASGEDAWRKQCARSYA